MNRRMMMVVMLALAAMLASPAMAAREWRGGYGNGPGAVRDVTSVPGLNLSAEQTERVKTLREAHLKDIEPLLDQIQARGQELRKLWLAETPEREKILALQKVVHGLRGQLLEKLAAYHLAVRQILTPEQQAKIKDFAVEQHMRHRGAGMRWGPPQGAGQP
ncbi:MAG: Spy/CpxP family protein refolding chaperone [Deltaproteobacteria bacterium]|nr:Spy/CpxP family protein refolding chaperone [Deltaproteobacteria bacterium]